GSVYGFQTCVAASITHHLLCDTDEGGKTLLLETQMKRGLMGGLAAKQQLIQSGHGKVGDKVPGFPIWEVAGCISKPPGGFVDAEIPDHTSIAAKPDWTILEKKEHPDENGDPTPLLGLALLTARYGLDALSDIPSFSAEGLFSIDRREIESLRTIESLIQTYEAVKVQEKPLSIGVFGPPGAGKSFAVKALSKAILGEKVPFLEFNLSQFKDPNELIGAFHRVRDEVLKGKTPVAFWDEFDSQKFKWLQYLLAPMQDGAFQEGQVTHPIGKCIFIFAGGTSPSFAHFESRKPTPLSDDDYLQLVEAARVLHDRKVEFQLLKGPDFASRLHGHLNVLGPNAADPSSQGAVDLTWSIRRALMLRGILKLDPKAELDIDEGLLRALLSVDRYTHGSRSFEKIILALKQHSNHGRLIPSSLLPESLLQQETDAKAFQGILSENESFIEHLLIEKLAAKIHENYLNKAKQNNWPISPETDRDYAELSEDKKVANRAAARRIPEQLSLIDYRVVDSKGDSADAWLDALTARIDNHLERLAISEHLGWNAERRANGWVHGKTRDDTRKKHPSLVSWSELSETDREKDRENVKTIPRLLKEAGLQALPRKKPA
ncbi:MAG: AAA family ATPase, partial [Verrucomicrobiae bacterium]|nr:AAA family ATPase [Verrucomicrobiae bacterium]